MEKPYAITLDIGSSLANKTGAWRTNRPLYVDRLPPCNHACPAGENIQGWLYHAESGDYEAAWRVLTEDNPLAAVMGRVCYHPCETSCNRGKLDEAVGINSVERFLGDEAIKRGWKFAPPAAESGKRVLVVGAGPSGLSAAYHLRRLGHARQDRRGGSARRRHDALRHPAVPAAARRARCRDSAHPRPGRRARARLQGFECPRHHAGGPLRRGVPRGRRAHRQARLHSGGRSRAHARRRVGAARHGRRGQADARPARRRVRRRQYRARRRAHGEAAGRHRIDHRLPPHARKDAGARLRGRGGAAGRRADQVAVDDQEHGRRGHAHRREDGARRQGLPAADRRVRDARGRLARAGARTGRRSVAPRRRAGARHQGRHGAGRPQHDDRPSGHLRRRRHGAVRAHGDGGHRPRQEGRAPHRCVALRHGLRARRRSTSWPRSTR